jgi:predicted RNase H-like HicB family nuclease
MKKTYTLVATPEKSGWWSGHIKEEPAAISQGKSLEQLQTRIREALEALLDRDLTDVQIVTEPQLPLVLNKKIALLRELRLTLDATQTKHSKELRRAARALDARGFSRRDAAKMLGVSHQRVQQLLTSDVDAT